MKNAPIPAVLDFWALGHSASVIAEWLGFPNHRHITRIIANARRIGDPRAVIHEHTNGKPAGNFRKIARMHADSPAIEIVPLIAPRLLIPPKLRGPGRK